MVKISKKERIAWAAGFFEGEGCFSASYNKVRKDGHRASIVVASLSQKEKNLLIKFKDIIGFGSVYGPNSQNMCVWQTTRKGQPKQLFDMLKFWLSDRRRKRFIELYVEEQTQVLISTGRPTKLFNKRSPKRANSRVK